MSYAQSLFIRRDSEIDFLSFFFFSFFVQKDKRSIRVFQSPRITIVLAAAWNLRAFPANEGSSASSTVTTRLMKLNDGAKSARGYADISGKSGLCSATVYQAKSRRRHPPPLKKELQPPRRPRTHREFAETTSGCRCPGHSSLT